MTPDTPTDPITLTPPMPAQAAPALAASAAVAVPFYRNRLWELVTGLVLLLAVGGAGSAAAVWWWRRPQPPVPVIPQDIIDPEVRAAIESARDKVLKDPQDADAWGFLGMTLMANQFSKEADPCFEQAALLNSRSPKWPYARGMLLVRGDPRAAVPFLRQAAALADSTTPEYQYPVRWRLAETLLELRELDEAEQIFRESEPNNRGNPRVIIGLGLVALAAGRDRAAEEFFNKAKENPLTKRQARVHLAALAGARGDNETAAQLEKEIANMPNDQPWPDPLLNEVVPQQAGFLTKLAKAESLQSKGEVQQALEIYYAEIAKRPNPQAYVGAGSILTNQGEYDKAETYLRKAKELAPEYSLAHYCLAIALYRGAEKQLRGSPMSPAIEKKLRESIAEIQLAVKLNPTFAPPYMLWGKALLALKEPAEAVKPLSQGVVYLDSDIELRLVLCEALLASGQDQEADRQLEMARKLNPDEPRVRALVERRKRAWWPKWVPELK